jgi:hypothetical protein
VGAACSAIVSAMTLAAMAAMAATTAAANADAGASRHLATATAAGDVAASRAVAADTVPRGQNVSVDSLGNPAPAEPDPALTPGDTLPVTAQDVCTPGYSHKVRNVPAAVKREVYARYGIAYHRPGEYEVDHLISLELGGSNSIRNLWAESHWTSPWNAHVKDALENALHRLVCAGRLDLHTAQRAIATDWIAAYEKYVGQKRAGGGGQRSAISGQQSGTATATNTKGRLRFSAAGPLCCS